MCSSESSLLKLLVISGITYDTFCPIRRIRELTQRLRQRNDKEDSKKAVALISKKHRSTSQVTTFGSFLGHHCTTGSRHETSLCHVYVGSVHKTSNKCPIVNSRKHTHRSLKFDASSLRVKFNRDLNTCLISSVQSVQTKMMSTISLMEGILSWRIRIT